MLKDKIIGVCLIIIVVLGVGAFLFLDTSKILKHIGDSVPTVVSEEDEEVQVQVVGTMYSSAYNHINRFGWVWNIYFRPARYYVICVYDDDVFRVDNKELYDKYKDNGEFCVKGTLVTTTLSNGLAYKSIKNLRDSR